MAGRVQLERARLQQPVAVPDPTSPENGLDACHELTQRERLAHVVALRQEVVGYAALDDVRAAISELDRLFQQESCSKEQVIAVLSKHLPTFEHREKHKYLDQRM